MLNTQGIHVDTCAAYRNTSINATRVNKTRTVDVIVLSQWTTERRWRHGVVVRTYTDLSVRTRPFFTVELIVMKALSRTAVGRTATKEMQKWIQTLLHATSQWLYFDDNHLQSTVVFWWQPPLVCGCLLMQPSSVNGCLLMTTTFSERLSSNDNPIVFCWQPSQWTAVFWWQPPSVNGQRLSFDDNQEMGSRASKRNDETSQFQDRQTDGARIIVSSSRQQQLESNSLWKTSWKTSTRQWNQLLYNQQTTHPVHRNNTKAT